MSFMKLAETRQSCRNYDPTREVETEKLERILEAARLSPSACNGQPYHVTVCRGDAAKRVAKAVQGMGMNKFADSAPVMLVISDEPYVKTAAFGAKLKGIDYRSIDMGILAAYITAAATEGGAWKLHSRLAQRRRNKKYLRSDRPRPPRYHSRLCR